MKITDIYTNLKNKIELRNKKKLNFVNKVTNSISTLKNGLNNRINLKNEEHFYLKDKLCFPLENFDLKDNLDLKQKIKRKKTIKYKIKKKLFLLNYNLKNISFKNFFKSINFSFLYKLKKIFNLKFLKFFFFILLLFIIDGGIVLYLIKSGVSNLYSIKNTRDLKKIEQTLKVANLKFGFANVLFIPFSIIPERNITNLKNGIYILNNSTRIGLDLISFYKSNINFIKNKKINEIYFGNLLTNSRKFLLKKEKELKFIEYYLDNISLDKENKYYLKLNKGKKELNKVINLISLINNNFDAFLGILGQYKTKNYLIVFQNNDEIRPTGGFMGSAGIIKIFAGRILDFTKKDIYALEWDAKKNYHEQVKGPTGINLLSKRLGLRDSNAFINFYTSAKSINYFMNKAGYNIDGIVFINQKIILDILELFGDIDFEKYNTKINSKNFSEVISLLVEAKVSKKATLDTPKQVLFDFSKILKQKLLSNPKYSFILKVILNNVKSRDFVFISFNKKENNLLSKLGITGEFDYYKQDDFNYPFFISVGGNKSDRYIKRDYRKEVRITKNTNGTCNLFSHFELTLTHTFSKKDEERIRNEMKKFKVPFNINLLNIQGKGINKSYTKVVVPENALLDLKHLKKYNYSVLDHKKYKTVEKLLITKPGETSYFNFDYTLTDLNCNNLKIAIYKQSGIYNYNLKFDYINNSNNKVDSLNLNGLDKDFYYNK